MALLPNQNQQNPNQPALISDSEKQPDSRVKQVGTGFSNIQNILGANQNNRLASNIGSNISGQSQRLNQQVNQAQQGFGQNVQQQNQKIASGQNLNNTIQNTDFNAGTGEQQLQNAGTAQNQQLVGDLSTGYKGQQGLNNQSQIINQSQNLANQAQQLGTDYGRSDLLRRYVGGNQYTQGQNMLDNLLLGTQNNQLGGVKRAATQASQTSGNAVNAAQQQANALNQQTTALGQGILGNITQQSQNLGGALDTRVQNQSDAAQQQLSDYTKALQAGNISQDQYNTLTGLDSALGGQIYGLTGTDISNQLNANTDYNRSNVANSQDVGALNALATLGNQKAGDLLDIDQTKAGTAGPGLQLSSDAQGILGKAITGSQKTTQDELDRLNSYITNAGNYGTSNIGQSGGFSLDPNSSFYLGGLQGDQASILQNIAKTGGLQYNSTPNPYGGSTNPYFTQTNWNNAVNNYANQIQQSRGQYAKLSDLINGKKAGPDVINTNLGATPQVIAKF